MLRQEEPSHSSEYSSLYALIIPPDNLLRRINDLVDFSFIYSELEGKYCHNNGRHAESPIRMFKYLLLKAIYDMSDVGVVERSMFDMSFKYFLGMAPEEGVIHPSSLTKFRKLRLQDGGLLDLLIGKTVSIALEKGIIKSKSIIVDATHTLSRSNPISTIDALRERSKRLRKAAYDADEGLKGSMPKKNEESCLEKELAYCKRLEAFIEGCSAIGSMPSVKERLRLLREASEDVREHLSLSKDKDAKIGHKSADSSFFGYKTHIAMTEERIITAAVVTSGEKADGPELARLLAISQGNGIEVEEIIGDTAYSGKDNLELMGGQNIKVVARLNPVTSQGRRKDGDKFDYNKDAGMFICPAGHMAIRKARHGKKGERRNQRQTYYFDVGKCRECPLKAGCYTPGAKTRTYSVSIKSGIHQEQSDFQETEYFKQKAKLRYKIEAKNGELKNAHGYKRAISYGINSMQMQGAMAIFTVNLKRIIKLIPQ